MPLKAHKCPNCGASTVKVHNYRMQQIKDIPAFGKRTVLILHKRRYLEPEMITDAFLHAEKRKVDKAGCISFSGKKYEVGLSLIGCTVDVIYDPADFSELTVEYEGHPTLRVKPLVIGEYAGQKPKLPETLTEQPVDCSRLLNAAEKV